MTDIVERLRCGVDTNEPPDKTDRLMAKAADEIERLRAEIERLRTIIEPGAASARLTPAYLPK